MKKSKKILPPKFFLGIVFLVSIGFAIGFFVSEEKTIKLNPEKDAIRICFSPEGQCENWILSEIEKAKDKILIQSYAFTSIPISNALLKAKNTGIDIHILCDESQYDTKYSQLPLLKKNGVNILIDSTVDLAHNKIIIIDDETVFTGSYNFTKAANTRNAENLLLIRSESIAQIYTKEWEKRFANAI